MKWLTTIRNHLTAIPPRDWCLIIIGTATAAGVLFLPDVLYPWLLVADLLAGCAALGYLYLDADHRAEREADENFALRFDLAGAQQTIAELDQENARLHMELTEAQLLGGGVVRVPFLRVVPPSEEVTGYEWPAIMRAVEGETGEHS